MKSSLASPATGSSSTLQAYGQQVDGLFTYCLSVLCEHDAAMTAVAEVRDLALRHGARLAEPGLRRAWLYALARHVCLGRLEQGLGGADAPPGPAQAAQRQRDLSSLAWPEAAGTDPGQREALELAVRHRLSQEEVAAVLGLSVEAAEALLAAAGAVVGQTRTALLVLGVGSCPELAQLGGVGAESWRGWVLGPALRRELVQHVVDCPTCRGTAGRVSGELDAGLEGLPGLPLLTAPVTVRIGGTAAPQLPDGSAGAAFLAGAAAGRRASAGAEPTAAELRFDQRGFPRHRAPASGRALAVRQRVVTTGVLAAVLAAPVLALWGAHRDGGSSPATSVSSVRVGSVPRQEDARPAHAAPTTQASAPMAGLQLVGAVTAETSLPMMQGPAVPVPSGGVPQISNPVLVAMPSVPPTAGRLTVEASEYGSRTVITLTNSGGSTVQWHAVVDVDWLRLSRDSGTLSPGQRITVTVTVDDQRVPQDQWTARIALPPSDAVVTLEGGPANHGGPTPSPTPSGTPNPNPTPSSASPTPPPSQTPSQTPSPTPSQTPSQTPSPTPSSTPSQSSGPGPTPSQRPSSSPGATHSHRGGATPTA